MSTKSGPDQSTKIRGYLNTGVASYSSLANLGAGSGSQGQNSIHSGNCIYDVSHTGGTQLKAEYNYWGETPPNASQFSGNVDYSPYLSTDPLPKISPWTSEDFSEVDRVSSATEPNNFPNPFNPSTTIEFHLSTADNVEVVIYNILGQVVNRLIDERLSEGTHQIAWDGTDQRGKPMASGVYLYRVATDHVVTTKKMVIVR